MKTHGARLILVEEHGHRCFLGGTISKKNPLTVHHMTPVRAGGQTVLVNLALLCRLQHDMFNVIERVDPTTAYYLNEYFAYFKDTHDVEMLKIMKQYVEDYVRGLGYCVVEDSKQLKLCRK